MIGKLVITAIVLGSGAFLLLSDSFEIFISPFASAAASDIENMQNDPVIQSKFSQALDAFYENLGKIQFSISDLFKN
jgi:hypothetical protein